MQPHERIFVAVDTNDIARALRLIKILKGKVGGFKFGLELITTIIVAILRSKENDPIIEVIRTLYSAAGEDVFWDNKFADIPNTVGAATAALQPISPKFLNVHASSGVAAMKAAVENKGNSKVLSVTLLTSFEESAARDTFESAPPELVLRWARQAKMAAVDGLICSPNDLAIINSDPDLIDVPKMTPGIRPTGSKKDDQARISTPAGAIRAGSTWLVVGRPITDDPKPDVAAGRIADEIAQVV